MREENVGKIVKVKSKKKTIIIVMDSSSEDDEINRHKQEDSSKAPNNEILGKPTVQSEDNNCRTNKTSSSDEELSVNNSPLDLAKLIAMTEKMMNPKRVKEIDEELATKLQNPRKVNNKGELENENFELKLLLNLVMKGFGYSSIQEILSFIIDKTTIQEKEEEENLRKESDETEFELLDEKSPTEFVNVKTESLELHLNQYTTTTPSFEKDRKKRPSTSIDGEFASGSKKMKTQINNDGGTFDSTDDGESSGDRVDVKSKRFDDCEYSCQGSTINLKRHNKPLETFTSLSIPQKEEMKRLLSILCEWNETATGLEKKQCPDPKCRFTTQNSSFVRDHFSVKHLGKRYKCPVPQCGSVLQSKQGLVQHLSSRYHTETLSRETLQSFLAMI